MLRKLLLSPDASEGTPPAEPVKSGEKPPAAAIVLTSDATEKDAAEIVRLKRELADTQDGKKKVEMRAAELEDQNRQLKALPAPPAPPAKAKESKWAWLNGV